MIRCTNCDTQIPDTWVELRRWETVPTPGDGGGTFCREQRAFCDDDCLRRWLDPELGGKENTK